MTIDPTHAYVQHCSRLKFKYKIALFFPFPRQLHFEQKYMSSLGPLLPILNPFVLFNNQRINAAQTLPINVFSFVSFQTNPLTTLMVCSIKSTMTNRRVQQNYKSNIVSFRCHWIKTWNFLILLLDMFTLVTIISHPIQPFVWFAKAAFNLLIITPNQMVLALLLMIKSNFGLQHFG